MGAKKCIQLFGKRLTSYERLVAAEAFSAFLAALAAAEALRRRLVFGGTAGASPMSSAVMMLVTKSLLPWSSKSTEVRSASDAVTIPSPYTSCLIVWPSCITCTVSSLVLLGTVWGHSL